MVSGKIKEYNEQIAGKIPENISIAFYNLVVAFVFWSNKSVTMPVHQGKLLIILKVLRMRFSILLRAIIFTLMAGAVSARAESPDESLKVYAVNINHKPKQAWTGYGIYLGKGLVITAAHVVGHALETHPTVSIAGKELVATVVKEGDFETVDLTLLAINENQLPVKLQLRREPICESDPWIGQPVVVVVPESIARSRVLSPKAISPNLRARFSSLIADVATTGNSGSGVFDARRKCLLGIMSRKIQLVRIKSDGESSKKEMFDIAKYFVPASVIRKFIPPEFGYR